MHAACCSCDFTGTKRIDGRVTLPALHIRLHILWRYQLHLVAERLKETPPVMRASARLNGDQRRRKSLEISDHLAPPHLAAEHYVFVFMNSVELKHGFRRVHANAHLCVHFALLSSRLWRQRHQAAAIGGRPHQHMRRIIPCGAAEANQCAALNERGRVRRSAPFLDRLLAPEIVQRRRQLLSVS